VQTRCKSAVCDTGTLATCLRSRSVDRRRSGARRERAVASRFEKRPMRMRRLGSFRGLPRPMGRAAEANPLLAVTDGNSGSRTSCYSRGSSSSGSAGAGGARGVRRGQRARWAFPQAIVRTIRQTANRPSGGAAAVPTTLPGNSGQPTHLPRTAAYPREGNPRIPFSQTKRAPVWRFSQLRILTHVQPWRRPKIDLQDGSCSEARPRRAAPCGIPVMLLRLRNRSTEARIESRPVAFWRPWPSRWIRGAWYAGPLPSLLRTD
jgi:hypothetical protein